MISKRENSTLQTSLMTRVFCLAFVVCATAWNACAQTGGGQAQVIWIALEGRTQLKKTAVGTTLEGKLARSVYWRDLEVFPKGSTVRMVVDHIESRRKSFAADDRPFVIHLFAPRHEVIAQFRSVNVLMRGDSTARNVYCAGPTGTTECAGCEFRLQGGVDGFRRRREEGQETCAAVDPDAGS